MSYGERWTPQNSYPRKYAVQWLKITAGRLLMRKAMYGANLYACKIRQLKATHWSGSMTGPWGFELDILGRRVRRHPGSQSLAHRKLNGNVVAY